MTFSYMDNLRPKLPLIEASMIAPSTNAMNRTWSVLVVFALASILGWLWFKNGASKPLLSKHGIQPQVFAALDDRTESIEDFDQRLVILPTVFWEPLDTTSLRKLIRRTPLVRGKKILEIGTGSGLVSLCCVQAGASEVIATDVNQNAVECARVNADRLGFGAKLSVRLVDTKNAKAFAVIPIDERFDLIISNPPWEEGKPKSIDQYALYDPNFELLKSLLVDARSHLNPKGELYLAYGCKTAFRLLEKLSGELGYDYKVLDDRKLDDLTEVFLPGMLLQLIPKSN